MSSAKNLEGVGDGGRKGREEKVSKRLLPFLLLEMARRSATFGRRMDMTFRLRTVLLAMFTLSLPLAFCADAYREAQRQRECTAIIRELGGRVSEIGNKQWMLARWRSFDVDLEAAAQDHIRSCLVAAGRLQLRRLSASSQAWASDCFPLIAAQARNLRTIVINGGKLDRDSLIGLQSCSGLTNLIISDVSLDQNAISELCPRLPLLSSILLEKMDIGGMVLASLAKCDRLEEVDIRRINMRPEAWAEAERFKQLRRLFISNCNVDDSTIRHFRHCDRLESLTLINTNLDGPGLTMLGELRCLKSLVISKINSEYPSLDEFHDGAFINATEDERMTGRWRKPNFASNEIPNLPSLRELGLVSIRMKDDDWHALSRFSSLSELNCEGSDCPIDVIRELCKGNPTLEVVTAGHVYRGDQVRQRFGDQDIEGEGKGTF